MDMAFYKLNGSQGQDTTTAVANEKRKNTLDTLDFVSKRIFEQCNSKYTVQVALMRLSK